MKFHCYSEFSFKSGIVALKEAPGNNLTEKFRVRRILTIDQQSSDTILHIDYKDISQLSKGHSVLGKADALIISDYKKLMPAENLIGITTADCLPIIIENENQIALIHAGWRGLALGLIQKTINLLASECENKADSKVLIAPAAKGCCYEVGSEVLEALHFGSGLPKQKIDLQTEASKIFQKILPEAEIFLDSRCTVCSNELHSYRRDKTELRNLTFIII